MPAADDARQPKDVARQRTSLMLTGLVALPVSIGLWLAVYFGTTPLDGMEAPIARLIFAINCICVAVLLCYFLGIEAVSHERLHTPAINPLAGAESARMKVNLRYLQHTLEQLLLFIPGLLSLSYYCADGRSMRAVTATTIVWIVSRAAFWIGYHQGPEFRTPGLMGMVQSAIVLLYVCARFGYDVAGIAGTVVILGLFAGGEIYLVMINRGRPSPSS
jgi:hypothetical protein